MTLTPTEQVIEEAEANARDAIKRALSAELALRYIVTRLQEDRDRLVREAEARPERSGVDYAFLFGCAFGMVDLHGNWADAQADTTEAAA